MSKTYYVKTHKWNQLLTAQQRIDRAYEKYLDTLRRIAPDIQSGDIIRYVEYPNDPTRLIRVDENL